MAFQDLMQALNNLNQGMTELSAGRAIRSASEQAQMINMNEQDQFKKNQAFTQLGQGLAAQLSSIGASPTQVQQASQIYMPKQLTSPADFFAQAAQATSPEAAQQYQQAGQQVQAGLASAPLTTAQNEQFKIQKMQLLNERLALGGKPLKDEDVLSIADKKMIETLSSKNAGKLSISNNLQSLIDQWPSLSESEKLQQGREILKVLNSAEGSDAVGAEEVKRLGSKLEYAFGNFTNSNEIQFGRNLDGFFNDVKNTTARLQNAVERNDMAVSKIYKKYGKNVPVQKQTPDNGVSPVDEALAKTVQSKFNTLTDIQQQQLSDVLKAMRQRRVGR